jgi:hypothetical protein
MKKTNKTKKVKLLKIDLGAGENKIGEDWVGVDIYKMKGTDIVFDLADKKKKWPFKDNSVDEAHASHFIEHLTNLNDKWERVHFFNELYRVMKKGAKATLIFPHWCSGRYYGDPTHKEPFSEFGFYYLSKDWRLGGNGNGANAPHSDIKWNKDGYSCDFEVTWGYNLRPDLMSRNTEFQQNALLTQKEAAQDIIATVIKK